MGTSQGLDFLPCFHVIVTTFQSTIYLKLTTFHGKVIREQSVSCINFGANIEILQDLELNKLRLCQGVQDVKSGAVETFLRNCQLPIHEKIRSLFLIEQVNNNTTFRSRSCKFAVLSSSSGNDVCCSECKDFTSQRALSFNEYLKKVQQKEVDPVSLISKVQHSDIQQSEDCDASFLVKVQEHTKSTDEGLLKSLRDFQTLSQMGMLGLSNVKEEKDQSDFASEVMPLGENNSQQIKQDEESYMETSNAFVRKYDLDDYFVGHPLKCNEVIKEDTESIVRKLELKRAARQEKLERRRQEKLMGRIKKRKTYPSKYRKACSICLYTYHAPSLVQNCMTRHEEELNLDQNCQCPICYIEVPNRRLVTQHFTECHEGKTCCPECLVIIPIEKNRLRRHIIRKHHSAGKPVVCPQCGKMCATQRHLRLHLQDHEGNAAVCDQCGQMFAQNRSLADHLARAHQPRDMKCLYCEKLFENRQQARRHIAVHTGIKPYKCIQCNYSSYRQTNVHTHVSKTHGTKSVNESILVNEDEQERMNELVRVDVDRMLEQRKIKDSTTLILNSLQ